MAQSNAWAVMRGRVSLSFTSPSSWIFSSPTFCSILKFLKSWALDLVQELKLKTKYALAWGLWCFAHLLKPVYGCVLLDF